MIFCAPISLEAPLVVAAGIDMSPLFSEMIMATATKDLVQKKMCYLYLSNYASLQVNVAWYPSKPFYIFACR